MKLLTSEAGRILRRMLTVIVDLSVLATLVSCSGSLSIMYFSRLQPAVLVVASSTVSQNAQGDWIGSFEPITFTIKNQSTSEATGIAAALPAGFLFLGGSYPGQGGTCASLLPAGSSCTIVIQAKNRQGAITGGTIGVQYSLLPNQTKSLLISIAAAGPNPISPMYNPAKGFNADVTVAALAADGSHKLYAAGYFTLYNNTVVPNLLRINLDGSIDFSFNAGTGFVSSNPYVAPVSGIAPASDGTLYVCGGFTSYNGTVVRGLAHLFSDGSLDTAFVSGGGTGVDYSVTAIALANDGSGKIYLGGGFINYNGVQVNGIARLNTDGSLDSTFNVGSGSTAGFNNGYYSDVYSIAVANDGSNKIYVGAHFFSYDNQQPPNYCYLFRINSDGSLDTTFNNGNGGADASYPLGIYAIEPLSSGEVYVGGTFDTYNGTSSHGLMKLKSDGTLDTTFSLGTGFSGVGTTSISKIALTQDASNDIVVLGSFKGYQGNSTNGIARLHSDGSYDSGTPLTFLTNSASLAIPLDDGSGNIYLTGGFLSYESESQSFITRVKSDGSIDTSFTTSVSGFDSTVNVVATSTDGSGRVYVGGTFNVFNNAVVHNLARVNYDGTIDTSFNSGGAGFNGTVRVITVTSDGSGQLYVGGSFTAYNGTAVVNGLVRLNSDGSLDSSFASGFAGGVSAVAIATDGSGKIYVGYNSIARLNSSGSVDASFSPQANLDFGIFQIQPLNDGSGRVYASGYVNNTGTILSSFNVGLIRLRSDGSLDPSFDYTHSNDYSYMALAQDGSGKIYVGGGLSLERLNSDGTVDTSFSTGAGITGTELSTLVAPNDGTGQIYVGGLFSSYNGAAVSSLFRLNADGSLDSSFSAGTGFWSGMAYSGGPFSLAIAPDYSNRIYVGGLFGSYQSTIISNFARLECDGRLDN